MSLSAPVRESFNAYRVCVIIPTYNNAATLQQVIQDVSVYTNNIIVVNDGSSDNTPDILSQFPSVHLITYQPNAGKGWALRQGFDAAVKLNYQYAISIDSDGQHFAYDLPAFINQLMVDQNAVIIGARNMNQSTVPGGSNFGNKFSNFWFKVETGITAPDTQSGYRLYPLEPIKKMHFFSKKYEFEIEVLVRLAWSGVKVVSVPVTVYYAPKEARVSHFRPYKDFFRISVLNTLLVLIAFLYVKPRDFFKSIFVKRNLKRVLKDQLINSDHSAVVKSVSVAFGVFMGIVPIWGFQLLVAISLAILFKLNKVLVIIAANISIPPMIPFIIFGSYKAGAAWMGKNAVELEYSRSLSLDIIKRNLQQYIYGSITLAVVAGLFFGLLTLVLLKIFRKQHQQLDLD
jgi:glycosyltransferase involved in cell wall biosynthesis